MAKEDGTEELDELEQEPQTEAVEDDEHGSYEAEEKGDSVIVKTKRDPDRLPGESRRDYSRRKAEERQEAAIQKHTAPLMDTVRRLEEIIAKGALSNAVNSFKSQPKPSADSDENPFGDAHAALVDEQGDVLSAIRAADNEADIARLRRRYNNIESKKRAIEVESTLRRQQERQPQRQAPQRNIWMETLEMEFPDVMGNETAMTWVRARAAADEIERAHGRRPKRTIEDDRKDLKLAAETFGMRRTSLPPPNKAQQAKLGGSSTAPSSGGSIDVELTDSQMSLAMEQYPGKKPAVAAKLWVRDMREAGIKF